MVQKAVNYFYPDLGRQEARKFGLLGIIFFLIIGTYWLLRLLKNTIFFKVAFPEVLGWAHNQGGLFQPIAKQWSFVVILVLVLVYSKLVDLFEKHKLFYILCTFYGIFFAAMGTVILLSELKGPGFVGKYPLAITGWASFFLIESFGSFVVALFWAFTNSITDPNSAKRGFPFVIMMAQTGAIIGSALLLTAKKIGIHSPFLFGSTVVVFLVIPMVRFFIKTTPKEMLIGYKAKKPQKEEDLVKKENSTKKKEGFFKGFTSGLVLLVTHPYLLGVLIVSTIYEAVSQLVEYQMQRMADKNLTGAEFTQFQSFYGVSINVLAFLIALLGTSYVLKKYGVRVSIMIYPVAFGITLLGIYAYSSMGTATLSQLLWVTFGAMVLIKAIGYAVNNPTKEMMYIPTSKDAKFKTKSWIDTFGARGAKAGGARINDTFKHNLNDLMVYGTIFGLALIVFWTIAAFFIGKKNTQLVENGEIVE